eukprot:Unigene15422_Nuclearia_a/m.46083 Unigene15422_Nuclearia_a/g.46083  ORF Unigene15422_Nuclearia_a/g.46083 Unigene15422_Nuclearia_a/m.46083 type:complete len:110 (+) Unigene15422_Nuclearia_a:70-399(+)
MYALAIDAEQNLAYVGARDRFIRVYDATSLELLATFKAPHYDEVRCLALSGGSLYTAGGLATGFLRRYHVADNAGRTGAVRNPVVLNNAHPQSGVQGALAAGCDCGAGG